MKNLVPSIRKQTLDASGRKMLRKSDGKCSYRTPQGDAMGSAASQTQYTSGQHSCGKDSFYSLMDTRKRDARTICGKMTRDWKLA